MTMASFSGFDLSGGRQSSVGMPIASTGGRFVNGVWTVPNAGFGWNENGQMVNLAEQQVAQQAQQQAQSDLASFGGLTPYQIGQQAAGAADPFASQRPQYQNALANLMQGNFDINDPSYKFRFDQGQQALERSAAAKGFLGSGNILQELQNYGQGMASQEYQNQFNRLLPLTGAQNGSPGAAGMALSGLYDWRNNALANMGAAQQMQGGGSNPFLGSGGGSLNRAAGGGSFGGSNSGLSGGAGGGSGAMGMPSGLSPDTRSLGTTQAESDAALARQLAGGGGTYYGGSAGGGGFINAVPVGGSEQRDVPVPVRNVRGDDGKYYIIMSDGSRRLG